MTRLALTNPIAIAMLSIGMILFGAVVVPRMAVDTFPELTPPVLVVGTLAPGLGAKDVEKTISWRLEKYVSATPGVEHVESLSRNNLSVVYVWLKWGTDLNAAQSLVQQQTAFAMAAVPKSLGVLPPFVLQYDPSNAPVVQVVVSGEGVSPEKLYDYAQNFIEPVLEGIQGVASAAPNGGKQRQINVVVDPVAAQSRGVTSSDIGAAVAQANALLPSGVLLAPRFTANVYTNAIPEAVKSIGESPVKSKNGIMVRIEDVARVEDSGSPESQWVGVNGKTAVYLSVLRVPGGNTLQIVDQVKEAVGKLAELPPGVTVKAVFDQSLFVRTAYDGLQREIAQALVLICLVILVFLQSPRAVLAAVISIPISFGAILLVLYATGQTLNAFTLGGLTLAMGPLVDIAVVVVESIHRKRVEGLSPVAAALQGTQAVALPAFSAMLTTNAVLLPVALLSGLAKKLFVPLAITVATGMVAGFVVSMIVTPVASRFLFTKMSHGKLADRTAKLVHGLRDGYVRALEALLPWRMFFIGAVMLMVVAAVASLTKLPSTFFPEIDESIETVYVRMAPGTSLPDAAKSVEKMAKVLVDELPSGSVELVMTNMGTPNNARSAMISPNTGPHTGFIALSLADPDKRTLDQREIADEMRKILTEHFPGVEFLQAPGGLVANVFSNGYIAPLVVEVRGEDLNKLFEDSEAVAQVARQVPGVRDVRVSLENDYPELRVDLKREEAGLVGVSARAAGQTALEATLGNINTPGVWVDSHNGQSYYVVTEYDPARVQDPAAIGELPARAASGGHVVQLGAYANVRRTLGPIAVERNALRRVAHVLMQTERRDVGSAAAELERKLKLDASTRKLEWHFVGQIELMRQTFGDLGGAIVLALTLIFMIMASQFRSFTLPIVMLLTIPVSVVGIAVALMSAGLGFSVTALMGVLMVVGIAVSNGILLVDASQKALADGLDRTQAVLRGAQERFVPILMTSLATVIGLLPVALGLGHGAEANRPLALAVVGGLTSSTTLALFLVPSLFVMIARKPGKVDDVDAASNEQVLAAGSAHR